MDCCSTSYVVRPIKNGELPDLAASAWRWPLDPRVQTNGTAYLGAWHADYQWLGIVTQVGNLILACEVLPVYQGHGIGRALIRHMQARYPTLCADEVMFDSIGFWEHCGFVAMNPALTWETGADHAGRYLWPACTIPLEGV
ncbi:MAG: GNAT family N-acetyltransferase [Blastochloris sp.]|nr:GNAT family N-acetyltransferase [Blastochloris sp.]